MQQQEYRTIILRALWMVAKARTRKQKEQAIRNAERMILTAVQKRGLPAPVSGR
ncbi:MAG: hypothetical protein AAF485_22585 [Chloroflexota bacterium]